LTLRLRPTVWPGGAVPIPRVSGIREVRRDGQWLLLVLHGERVEVPPEVYLRQFRDTPAGDLDALADLCKLGPIRTLNTAQPYADLPLSTDEQWHDLLRQASFGWHGDERKRHEVWGRHHGATFPVHAAEVALRVRLLQATTTHLLAYLAGEPVTQAWPDCDDDLDAWNRFTEVTDAALRDFHVHVRVDIETRRPSGRPELRAGEVYTTLYGVAMLQLVNDLAAGEPVRVCANQTCQRPFMRQLGRSSSGGHRKRGTLYCSNTCARAQSQREKRRRDRAARS